MWFCQRGALHLQLGWHCWSQHHHQWIYQHHCLHHHWYCKDGWHCSSGKMPSNNVFLQAPNKTPAAIENQAKEDEEWQLHHNSLEPHKQHHNQLWVLRLSLSQCGTEHKPQKVQDSGGEIGCDTHRPHYPIHWNEEEHHWGDKRHP